MGFRLPFTRTPTDTRPPLTDRKALQDFNRSLALIVDPAALQASVAARIEELFGADRLILFLGAPGREAFVPATHIGFDAASLDGVSLRRRGPLARWLLVNETCLIVPRAEGVYEYLSEAEQATLARLGVEVCVPLVSVNRLTGIITLGSSRPGWALGPEDLELLQLLAGQAALAFENALLWREQRDRLQRLHRAERLASAGQLAAGVAHDIRNPLTAIRSTIQYVLQDYPEDSPKRALIEETLNEVDRIDRTVNGLLSLARPADYTPQPTDVLEIVRQALVLVTAQAGRQAIRIDTGDLSGRCLVMGDAGELKHLVVNLLINALQAMPDGGTLRVTAGEYHPAVLSGPRSLQIGVEDSGVGIRPEDLDKIFDPFFTTKRDGTGLGLSICHGIVQRHEGEIDVKSEPGRGTTMMVRLPLV
jgi:signal transduction histidine kinase